MVVNWNTGENKVFPDKSIVNIASQAGENLANVLISLGISEKNIHLIGHSLGKNISKFDNINKGLHFLT